MDETDNTIILWRGIIVGEGKSWVLFEGGTCVILPDATGDLAAQATELLREYGPVAVGTESADFDVVELRDAPGWVVTCYHPDILVYLGHDEFDSPETPDVMVGLLGRSRRDSDAHDLRVVHVEDKSA